MSNSIFKKEVSESARKKRSELMKTKWQDPEYRNKMTAILNDPENRKLANFKLTEYYNNVDNRNRDQEKLIGNVITDEVKDKCRQTLKGLSSKIYKVYCIKDNNGVIQYVGLTTRKWLSTRWCLHKNRAINHRGTGHFYAWLKNNCDYCHIELIEECQSKKQADIIENYWIIKARQINPCLRNRVVNMMDNNKV